MNPGHGQPGAAPGGLASGEPSLVGQVLEGGYEVKRPLGEGELTTVYEARHQSGRHFAVKVLRASWAARPGAVELFLRQAQAAAAIEHGNVVSIEQYGQTPTRSAFMAEELVVGETLEASLARDGRWPWARVRPIVLQVLGAVEAAHRAGVLHRSLKPSNCFVILDPTGRRDPFVKVSDFGMAQVGVEASQAASGATVTGVFGDVEYMAPEQGLGGQVGPGSDVYALGLVLYRMLTGQVPFSSPNAFQVISQHSSKPVATPRSIDASIPAPVEAVVMRCLAKRPDERFGGAGELRQALEAIAADGSTAAGAPVGGASAGGAPAAGAPRFARMNAGGTPGGASAPAPPPPRQPSVIVAGAIGDPEPSGSPGGAPVAPAFVGDAAPPPSSEMTSSFLASRPGLRMGLGASLPSASGDDPAPPATIAPGMAVPSPTMFPGVSAPFAGGPDAGGPPQIARGIGPGMPPPPGGPGPGSSPPAPLGGGSDPSLPPPLGGGYVPPSGPGPGMPSAGPGMPAAPELGGPSPGGYVPPSGPVPGMPSAGPGMPAAGGYAPPSGPGPGMPAAGSGMPPAGPGMPPMDGSGGSAGGYVPPSGPGPGMPSAGPGMPAMDGSGGSVGGYVPPSGPGPGMPSVGPGMPPVDGSGRSAGGYVPPSGPGAGMPSRAGVEGARPPGAESSPSSPVGSTYSYSGAEPPGSSGLGAVEYDEDEQPKRRPLLVVGIAAAFIASGVGVGLLIVGGDDGPEGDVAKVKRAEKNQDVEDISDEPEPEPAEPDEPEPDEPVKPKPKPKARLTFAQSLKQLKGRIRGRCSTLGPGPIELDVYVPKDGGAGLSPKVSPKGPIGSCALRIVERWNFPESEQDHTVDESVSW